MKLKELTINNFMPYKGEQKIVFPQHETQNVMLLFGDNMRGKTSFLNAIRWGFYGNAVGRHLREIPRANLVNMDAAAMGDWSLSIGLKFSNDGNEYELRRQINKKAHVSSPKNDSDFEEHIGLQVNGEIVPGDTVVNEINQVIPEEISRFFLFDGELLQEYENLLIENSEQGEKIKEHIEQALGVPALVHGRDELAILLKDARRIQAKDAKKNKELSTYAEQQRQLEIKLTSYEKDLRDQIAQKNDVQNQIDLIDDELKNTEAVQRKKILLEGLKGEREVTERNLVDLADQKRQLLKTAWKDVLHTSALPILSKLKEERSNLQQAMKNSAVLEEKIKNLSKILDSPTCTTCHQDIPTSQLAPIRTDYETFKAQAELSVINLEDFTELTDKIDKLGQIQSADEGSRVHDTIKKEMKQQVQLIQIETQLEELHEEIREYDTDHIMRQREKRDRLTGLKSRLSQDIDQIKQKIEKNENEQDHIATLISKNKGAQGQKSTIRVNLYQELEQVFAKGIDKLRDSLRERVQQYASNAFAELTTEKTYSGLEINHNYGLSIIDHENRVLKERSAGAEQVVALSLIDGLNRTARKSGPIVMDTPLGRLDPKHRSNVLGYLPKMAEQVVLLVHEGEIDPKQDMVNFAHRIGARYQIVRISATESRIEKA
ncbi:AAA family ATPase [Vibrio coralliirubri]|uniref:AAA family ATPase n=1 Tax=Vibrio coralliirubri TaxID=1516159 RepID=UPI000A3A31AD|nr:AAA family ATPase [Vibrio coralliirubri]